jgi:phosphate-selective porin OprO/OprP
MVHGRLFDRRLSYQAGYFGKDGDNARSPEMRGGRHAIAARAVITPMARSARPALAAFQIGVAVVSSRLDNQLGLRGKTVFGEGVFFDRVFVNGRRLRQGLEAAWAVGPVSLTWERSTVSDERGGMGAGGQRLADVRGAGWYVAGTWTLTGETKEGRVAPRRSVFNGGRGAFELAGRVERLAFDAAGGTMGGIEPAFNADRVLTAGLAWYLNRHLKVQSNLVLESILDPQHSPAPRGNGRMPRGVVQFQFVL